DVLTVSGNGAMKDYEYDIAPPWRGYTEFIKNAVIMQGIKNIGKYMLLQLLQFDLDNHSRFVNEY
ncbi:MAG: hypothetical protein LBD76_02695, partial [Prevotellaceae bacterium]|nr:hypothetical protein [Prevotellaceae bacterium]